MNDSTNEKSADSEVCWPKDQHAQLLQDMISPYATLVHADEEEKDRNVLLIKDIHGASNNAHWYAGNQNSIHGFVQHHANATKLVKKSLKIFKKQTRVMLERLEMPLDKLPKRIQTSYAQAARLDDPRFAQSARDMAINEMLIGGPRAKDFLYLLTSTSRIIAQLLKSNHWLAIPGSNQKAKQHGVAVSKIDGEMTELIKQACVRTIEDTELEQYSNKWRLLFDENHTSRHSVVRNNIRSLPKHVHTVSVVYGADHTKYGYHYRPRTVSRHPLEDYLSDTRLFVVEPIGFRAAHVDPPEGGQIAFCPQDVSVEELRDGIAKAVERLISNYRAVQRKFR